MRARGTGHPGSPSGNKAESERREEERGKIEGGEKGLGIVIEKERWEL